jgi:hypothetical protein
MIAPRYDFRFTLALLRKCNGEEMSRARFSTLEEARAAADRRPRGTIATVCDAAAHNAPVYQR